MKKAISIFLTMLIFCSLVLTVNAEEFNGADLFTVEIPDDFEQTGTNVTDFTFTNENGDTFAINYSDNTQEDDIFSPADMGEKEIKEYTDSISEEVKVVMKDFAEDFNVEFLSGERVKHKSGKTALVCQTKTTIIKNKKENVYYQTMCEFGGVDYKYSFTYTTDDENKKDRFNEVFETIDIFEAETESNLDKFTGLIPVAVIVLLLVIGIVKFIRTPEKRKQGKLK